MKKTHPIVSIGLTVFNAERWLEKTIQSLINQTYPNIEIIISDNASSDNSELICRDFQNRYNSISYYRNASNVGPVRNGTKVFDLANGDFFMWAGDHDLWDPNFVEKCVSVLLSDESVVLAYSQTILIDGDDNPIELMQDRIDTRGHTPIDSFRKILWDLSACNMVYGLFRKSVLLNLLPIDTTIGSDIILLGRASLLGAIAQITEPLFFRRQNRPKESPEEAERRWVTNLVNDDIKLEAKVPWLMMCGKHLSTVQSSSLTSADKKYLVSEIIASCTTRFDGSLRRELAYLTDTAVKLLLPPSEDLTSIEQLDLRYAASLIQIFYPNVEGIYFLYGVASYLSEDYEAALYYAKREIYLYPESKEGKLLEEITNRALVLNNHNEADRKQESVLKLYAGDLPNQPEYDGWLGLSLTQQNDCHILHDITQTLPFADNSVDAFQAEDVLEHIQYDKLPAVINEIYRILKPGGLFRLSVPDYGCDLLQNRSAKDAMGNIVFDPGGGGTPDNPGHVWFPRVNTVYHLLEKTHFHTNGTMEFLHYWNMDGKSFVTKRIDYSKGHIKRTPDHDERVKLPYRPMSIVVDVYKHCFNDYKKFNIYSTNCCNDSYATISTTNQFSKWYECHNDFARYREQMIGISEHDYINSDLKLIQDLCVCDFIRNYIKPGSKVLEIGGGNSRILSFFKDYFEGWNLDKFEGAGNGPKLVPRTKDYKMVDAYIGDFSSELPDNYFDLVFSVSVVEHINENDEILNKIMLDIDRILKPGGFSVHCIDCRFPPSKTPDIDNRRLLKYMLNSIGVDTSFIISESFKQDVFRMSPLAYNRFWKIVCGNRSYDLDGLPFNVFIVTRKL